MAVSIKGSLFFNMDCMDYLRELPDNAFELAIVDPPYGINFGEFNRTNRTSTGKTIKADKYMPA